MTLIISDPIIQTLLFFIVLESLIDSMTMCNDKKLIFFCGELFRNLCIEAVPENMPSIVELVMRVLPCDFNPLIQSMGFKVLQHLVVQKNYHLIYL